MQDLGVVDERGYALFLGRAKETLKVGGENVAPQEVEAQLCTHPAVKLAQVVGMPDERLIEVPAAFVELVPGAQVDAQELIDHVRGRVARFKVPRLIRFIDGADWPMSTTKIQRTALRARLLEELTQKGATP
jgi:acyl-coenzyme A synthetase/AMP-(fatty) acid ligase